MNTFLTSHPCWFLSTFTMPPVALRTERVFLTRLWVHPTSPTHSPPERLASPEHCRLVRPPSHSDHKKLRRSAPWMTESFIRTAVNTRWKYLLLKISIPCGLHTKYAAPRYKPTQVTTWISFYIKMNSVGIHYQRRCNWCTCASSAGHRSQTVSHISS